MKSISRAKRKRLHRAVAAWYRKHQRALQWRTTSDPYEILVSEIMLQQTQVSRVELKLPKFLKRFSSFHALAKASKADVIRAWEGMGYNNRAVRLHELARTVVKHYRGQLPSNVEQLRSLPGIGPYTAHAVACFAFYQHVPVVDVNIRRVLSRLFWRVNLLSEVKSEKEIWQLADHILPHNSYTWNQALMDLGATMCTAQKPKCSLCPVAQLCSSKHLSSAIHSRLKDKRKVTVKPLYQGFPRRIWRGKIIQTLRELPSQRLISLISLGRAMQLQNDDTDWLAKAVHQLESDGLVSTRKRLSQTMISLAA